MLQEPIPDLRISGLASRHPGLTCAIADNYLEAARVCLDRHHAPPTQFILTGDRETLDASLAWLQTDDRVRNAWANESDATHDGAYGCALAAVEVLENLVAIRRAETLSGADYYVGLRHQSFEDLEGCWRLEVSGTDRGNAALIFHRLGQKLSQVMRGRSNLPAMACVVGFRVRKIILRRLGLQ
jgi:hypothetical protein